jgi:hypothetical protein
LHDRIFRNHQTPPDEAIVEYSAFWKIVSRSLRELFFEIVFFYSFNVQGEGRRAGGRSPFAERPSRPQCQVPLPPTERLGNDTSKTTHPASVLNGP